MFTSEEFRYVIKFMWRKKEANLEIIWKKKQNKRKTKSKQTLNSIHFDMKLVTETYHVAAEVSE